MTATPEQPGGRAGEFRSGSLVSPAGAAAHNRLLRLLPEAEQALLAPHLEMMSLGSLQVLTDPGEPVRDVYFPETAVISMLRRMHDGTSIEVGAVGCDGMAGLSVAVGVMWSSTALVAAVAGDCRRMSAARLHNLLPQLPAFSALLTRYALTFVNELHQTIACNALHSVEQRCTRWLLTAHDWVGRDKLHLTHGVLAELLGVRRAGVTVAALALQRAGFIEYSRGHITVLDRAGLEAVACECRKEMRASTERLFAEPSIRPRFG